MDENLKAPKSIEQVLHQLIDSMLCLNLHRLGVSEKAVDKTTRNKILYKILISTSLIGRTRHSWQCSLNHSTNSSSKEFLSTGGEYTV